LFNSSETHNGIRSCIVIYVYYKVRKVALKFATFRSLTALTLYLPINELPLSKSYTR